MKRFDFPLERVRRWRRDQAVLEELKLRQLRGQLASLEAARMRSEADAAESHRQVLSERRIHSWTLESLDSYRRFVAGQIRDLESRKRQVEAQVAAQLNRVLEARRKAELLDRLRTDALKAWQTAANKEQEDLAAELFLAKSRRG